MLLPTIDDDEPILGDSLHQQRDHAERGVIHRALVNSGFNRTRAAGALGISRVTLYKKMRKYGQTLSGVVTVLNLENSASRKEFDISPLNRCATEAMFNAMDTNPKLGEVMHNRLNEVFSGAFGDYRQPSILERLGVHHA